MIWPMNLRSSLVMGPGSYFLNFNLSGGWGLFLDFLFEVPATKLTALGCQARADLGEHGSKTTPNNASRSAHAFVNRWNLAWKVPFSEFNIMDANEENVLVSYISPKSFVRFLLEKATELVMGGVRSLEQGRSQLEAFWSNYENFHPTHRLFKESHPARSKRNTLAVCFHGDEGRGKKKGNTAVLMFESCLGVGTASNIREKRRHDLCDECCLKASGAKRFKTSIGYMESASVPDNPPACSFQEHNTKNNSYLTKFVLGVLPNELYKKTNGLEILLDRICQDFKDLFENGLEVNGEKWFVAMTGLKGDLRWYEKIANLERCFNKQIGSGLQMCHECEAGSPQLPWEDASHFPCWGVHLYQNRPWHQTPSVATIPFEPAESEGGQPERILRRDIFHNTKMGLLRDFAGSTVLLLIYLGYFRDPDPGVSNARDVCLARAHRHFYLFCTSTGGKAALRSFTPVFFNAKTQTEFGWINAKGSDVTLLIKWIAVLSQGLLNDPLDQAHIPTLKRIYLGAVCVRTWQRILYQHGLWLPRHCAMTVHQELHDFLQHYNALAYLCLTKHMFTGYAMKSKFHMICHSKHELGLLLDDPGINFLPSPLMFGAEMNEDVIGKLARLSRRVDSRLLTKRTLQLYLCKCKAVHRRFRKNSSK